MAQRLELLVDALASKYDIPFKLTAGSGNVFGNGDHRMMHDSKLPIRLGVECKDSPTGNRKNHSVPWAEWEKAKTQIGATGATPIFVTGVQGKGEMVHMELEEFMSMVSIIFEGKIPLSAHVLNEEMPRTVPEVSCGTFEEIAKILSDNHDAMNVSPTDAFVTFSLGSLDVVEFIMLVKEHFDVQLPDIEAAEVSTVQQLVDLVEKYK